MAKTPILPWCRSCDPLLSFKTGMESMLSISIGVVFVGSSDHIQHADSGTGSHQRHFPHAFLEGILHQHGYDEGVANQMQMKTGKIWSFDLVHEWPAQASVNLWSINPDGQPDQTRVYGILRVTMCWILFILFTLIAAHMLGSLATIVARATAPDKISPGSVFPDF